VKLTPHYRPEGLVADITSSPSLKISNKPPIYLFKNQLVQKAQKHRAATISSKNSYFPRILLAK